MRNVVQCADQPPANIVNQACANHHSRAAGRVMHGAGQWRALPHRQRRKLAHHPHTILHGCLGDVCLLPPFWWGHVIVNLACLVQGPFVLWPPVQSLLAYLRSCNPKVGMPRELGCCSLHHC